MMTGEQLVDRNRQFDEADLDKDGQLNLAEWKVFGMLGTKEMSIRFNLRLDYNELDPNPEESWNAHKFGKSIGVT